MASLKKDKIVERLLQQEQITAEEAVVLLKETEFINPNPIIGPGVFPTSPPPKLPFEITCDENDMVPYGEICSCNPKNGGSGICGCVIGNKLVPKTSYPSGYSNRATLIDSKGCPNSTGICYCDGSCKGE